LKETQPNLKIAIFMSCFSADALPILIKSAPYLLTVFGSADDASAIEFARIFYSTYFQKQSIERACFFAQQFTYKNLQMVLTRRALEGSKGGILFQVIPEGYGDVLLIDLHEAEHDIEALGVSRESFLHALTRKIRLHGHIFNHPREQAIIPVGRFIGIFSWQNAKDVIQCHRILRMKSDVEDEACEVWADLAINYNDSAMAKYRLLSPYEFSVHKSALVLALANYTREFSYISKREACIKVLNKYAPEQYRLSKSLMVANLEIAQRKLESDEFGLVVVYLESALSAMHDLLDALTNELAVNV